MHTARVQQRVAKKGQEEEEEEEEEVKRHAPQPQPMQTTPSHRSFRALLPQQAAGSKAAVNDAGQCRNNTNSLICPFLFVRYQCILLRNIYPSQDIFCS